MCPRASPCSRSWATTISWWPSTSTAPSRPCRARRSSWPRDGRRAARAPRQQRSRPPRRARRHGAHRGTPRPEADRPRPARPAPALTAGVPAPADSGDARPPEIGLPSRTALTAECPRAWTPAPQGSGREGSTSSSAPSSPIDASFPVGRARRPHWPASACVGRSRWARSCSVPRPRPIELTVEGPTVEDARGTAAAGAGHPRWATSSTSGAAWPRREPTPPAR